MSVTLLGPQRRPTVDRVVTALGLPGPYATITAGWQDREHTDAELEEHLGGQSYNLSLWHRQQEVMAADPELAEADRRRRALVEEVQHLYLIGVGHAMSALMELYRQDDRSTRLVTEAIRDADAIMTDLDQRHLRRANQINREFFEAYPPHERPAVVRHREEVAAVLAECPTVVIAGGHVGVLLELLHLFNVAPLLHHREVLAWSAGAMALAETVVLFNDRATHGHAFPEVYGAGIGLAKSAVLLPSASQRLYTDNHPRMASMAHRFAPAWCCPLEIGGRVTLADDGGLPDDALVISDEGRMAPLAEAAALRAEQTPDPVERAVDAAAETETIDAATAV